jgi:hypothetical protein
MKLGFATLATLLFAASASRAGAQDEPTVIAELARQKAALERLERREAERAAAEQAKAETMLQLSGYVQLDWVLHNQASQDEVNYSTGTPLNQDRFTLRRGRLRAASERGYLAVH